MSNAPEPPSLLDWVRYRLQEPPNGLTFGGMAEEASRATGQVVGLGEVVSAFKSVAWENGKDERNVR